MDAGELSGVMVEVVGDRAAKGAVLDKDVAKAASAIECSALEPVAKLPPGYNRDIMKVKHAFEEDVKHR